MSWALERHGEKAYHTVEIAQEKMRHVVMLVMLAALGCSGCFRSTHTAGRAPSNDVLPFKATETTLANGLKVIVVPDRISESRQHPDPGADRLAQRSRARQVRASRTSSST